MSLQFPLFPFVPDFSSPVSRTTSTAHEQIKLAAGLGAVAFPQRTPDILTTHRFAYKTRLEIQQLKEFFRDRGGRTWAFFMPSWRRDLRLVGALAAGTKLIPIISPDEDYEAKHFTGTDADHYGRFLFFFKDGLAPYGINIIRVLPGTNPGEEILDIDVGLPWAVDEQTVVGWCHLSRFGDDQIEWQHFSPDHAEVEISFRATRRANQNTITQPITQIDQYGQLGFVSCLIAPGEAEPETNRVAYALGPANLQAAQEELYYTRWAVWPGSTRVRLKRVPDPGEIWLPDETGAPSLLFTAPIATDHITLAFDQNSWEVIAYQKTTSQIELRRFFNLGTDIRTWTGTDPILQYNALLNDDLETAQTDVVCYYLKPDVNSLFMRFQRDNFGIEYLACELPSRPLALKRAYFERNEEDVVGTLVVEYVDAGLRICQLRSALYPLPPIPEPPPPPPEVTERVGIEPTSVQLTHLPSYDYAVVFADGLPFEDDHYPLPDASAVILNHLPVYEYAVVFADGLPFEDTHLPFRESSTVSLINNVEYINVTIIERQPLEQSSVALGMDVQYIFQVISPPLSTEPASVQLTHSATYEPA